MRNNTRNLVYTALLIALGVVLPLGFHLFGAAGKIFLPMHLPVFIAGILLGSWFGMLVGLITPVLSSLLTGMPPLLPILPVMFFELALYGLTMGFCFQKQKRIYPGLLISMVVGRIGAGLVFWILSKLVDLRPLSANPWLFIWGSIVEGLPGIIFQLILIPLLMLYLKKGLDNAQEVFDIRT